LEIDNVIKKTKGSFQTKHFW